MERALRPTGDEEDQGSQEGTYVFNLVAMHFKATLVV